MQPPRDRPANPAPQPTEQTVDDAAVSRRPAHKHPEQIGPYRILESIGEGGMGVVYKAEQRTPVRRTVALKVIKLGMDTSEVVARFEAERQALALMSHPNVAKVFEAGMTENGRPFFAMEYVPGVALTDYCDQNKLTVRERLELFIPVCQAVQHAHQRGIIHRDLKPSNILVTMFDGRPVSKVIDFGIAKATNQTLTQHTLFTRTGSLVGTPEYMSPEQAMTSGLDVDTRTDIYSLGVILYELLTGTLPFDPQTLRNAGLEGMARIIKETEPAKPSTRLGTLVNPAEKGTTSAEAQLIAQRHRTELRTLVRLIRGDLDWIVLKALEKDRTRRYETANGLAMDVRRHLDNEPVQARPPSVRYRMGKFARKYRAAVGAAAALLLSLVLGIAGTTIGMLEARRAEARAVADRKTADQQRIAERQAHLEAETQRRKAESALAAMYPSNGFRAASLGDNAEASLWFASAANLADKGSELAQTNAIRADQWARQAIRPVAAIVVGSAVRATAFDPGDRYLLVEADDPADPTGAGVYELWDLEREQQVLLPSVGLGTITSAAWSPDGGRLALGGQSGQVCLCSIPQLVRADVGKLPGRVSAIAFSGDGRMLAGIGGSGAGVWDGATLDPLGSQWHLGSKASSVVWLSMNPPRVLLDCADGRARAYAVGGQAHPLFDFVSHPRAVVNGSEAVIAPIALDNGLVLSAGDNEVVWRDGQTGKVLNRMALRQPVRGMAELPEQVAVEAGAQIELFDKISGREERSFAGSAPLSCMAVRPDGRAVAAGAGAAVQIWTQTGGRLDAPPEHAASVSSIAYSHEGCLLATADRTGLVRIWAGPDPIPTARIPVSHLMLADFSPDERYVMPVGAGPLSMGSELSSTRVYSVETGQPQGPILKPDGSIAIAAFSFAGDHVITVGPQADVPQTVQLWDWRTGKSLAELKLPGVVMSLSLSRDGNDLAIVCSTREVLIVDQRSLTIRRRWPSPLPSISTDNILATLNLIDGFSGFSPDGRYLFTVSSQTIDVWQVSSGQARCPPIKLDGAWVKGMFLPDGKHLVASSMDEHVRVFDTETGQQASSSLSIPQMGMWFDCSPDSRVIFIGSGDVTMRLWDWQSGGRLVCPPLDGALFGRMVGQDRAISTSPTTGVRLWETRHGTQLSPTLHAGESYQFLPQVSPSGAVIVEPEKNWLRVFRTAELLGSPPPATDAVRRAELLEASSLASDASLMGLSNEQWLERWRNYRSHLEPSDGDSLVHLRKAMPGWDRRETELAERDDNNYAAEFHLDRLTAAGVIFPAERADLAQICMRRSEWAKAAAALGKAVEENPVNDVMAGQYVQALLLADRRDEATREAQRLMAGATPQRPYFQTDWWVAGPFPENLPQNFIEGDRLDVRRVLPPPPGSPSASSSRWRSAAQEHNLVQLANVVGGQPHTCTFAQREVYCAGDREITLNVSTLGTVQVWLNGNLTYERQENSQFVPSPLVKFRAGWNTLLLRVSGTQNQWVSVELTDDPMAVARMHEGKGELTEAAQSFAQVSAQQPKDPVPLIAGARILGRLGRFKESAADYRRAIDLHTGDHFAWYRGECTLAYVEDAQGYDAVRKKMLQKYESPTAPEIAERTAKACLLLPGSADDIARATNLADRALQTAPNHAYVPYFQLAKGMAEHRSGRDESAIEYLSKAEGSLRAALPKATAELWLALALHRTGHDAEAHQMYDKATSSLNKSLAGAQSKDQTVGGEDWLICNVSLRLASHALQVPIPSTQPAASR